MPAAPDLKVVPTPDPLGMLFQISIQGKEICRVDAGSALYLAGCLHALSYPANGFTEDDSLEQFREMVHRVDPNGLCRGAWESAGYVVGRITDHVAIGVDDRLLAVLDPPHACELSVKLHRLVTGEMSRQINRTGEVPA